MNCTTPEYFVSHRRRRKQPRRSLDEDSDDKDPPPRADVSLSPPQHRIRRQRKIKRLMVAKEAILASKMRQREKRHTIQQQNARAAQWQTHKHHFRSTLLASLQHQIEVRHDSKRVYKKVLKRTIIRTVLPTSNVSTTTKETIDASSSSSAAAATVRSPSEDHHPEDSTAIVEVDMDNDIVNDTVEKDYDEETVEHDDNENENDTTMEDDYDEETVEDEDEDNDAEDEDIDDSEASDFYYVEEEVVMDDNDEDDDQGVEIEVEYMGEGHTASVDTETLDSTLSCSSRLLSSSSPPKEHSHHETGRPVTVHGTDHDDEEEGASSIQRHSAHLQSKRQEETNRQLLVVERNTTPDEDGYDDEERRTLMEEWEYLMDKQREEGSLNDQEQEELQRIQTILFPERATTAEQQQLESVVVAEEEDNMDQHEVGYRPPSLLAMISHAQLELRPPPPKEHKKAYVPITEDAASIGRLVRLNETTIEAQGKKNAKEFNTKPTDSSYALWISNHSQRGQRRKPVTQKSRSKAQIMVHEAAALGKLLHTKRRTSSSEGLSKSSHHNGGNPIDIDDLGDAQHDGAKVFRTEHLIDRKVDGDRRKKSDDWTPDYDDDEEYDDLDQVVLPTEALPQFRPKPTKKSQREVMEEVAQGVAEGYWNRHYRLERPGAPLNVTEGCRCRYCGSANAWQTFAYQKKWAQERLPPDVGTDEDPEGHGYLSRLYLPQEVTEDVEYVDLKDEEGDEEGDEESGDLTSHAGTCSVDFSLSSLDFISESDDEDFASFGGDTSSAEGALSFGEEDEGLSISRHRPSLAEISSRSEIDELIPEGLQDSKAIISDIESTLDALVQIAAEADDTPLPTEMSAPITRDDQADEKERSVITSPAFTVTHSVSQPLEELSTSKKHKKPRRFRPLKWLQKVGAVRQDPNRKKKATSNTTTTNASQAAAPYKVTTVTPTVALASTAREVPRNQNPEMAPNKTLESPSKIKVYPIESPVQATVLAQGDSKEIKSQIITDSIAGESAQATRVAVNAPLVGAKDTGTPIPKESVRDRLERLKELQLLKDASAQEKKNDNPPEDKATVEVEVEVATAADTVAPAVRNLVQNNAPCKGDIEVPRESVRDRLKRLTELKALKEAASHEKKTVEKKEDAVVEETAEEQSLPSQSVSTTTKAISVESDTMSVASQTSARARLAKLRALKTAKEACKTSEAARPAVAPKVTTDYSQSGGEKTELPTANNLQSLLPIGSESVQTKEVKQPTVEDKEDQVQAVIPQTPDTNPAKMRAIEELKRRKVQNGILARLTAGARNTPRQEELTTATTKVSSEVADTLSSVEEISPLAAGDSIEDSIKVVNKPLCSSTKPMARKPTGILAQLTTTKAAKTYTAPADTTTSAPEKIFSITPSVVVTPDNGSSEPLAIVTEPSNLVQARKSLFDKNKNSEISPWGSVDSGKKSKTTQQYPLVGNAATTVESIKVAPTSHRVEEETQEIAKAGRVQAFFLGGR